MEKQYKQFKIKYPQAKENIALSNLSTMKIGGPADLYLKIEDIDHLPDVIQEAEKQKITYMIIGGGSNMIFADSGFRGLIVHITAKTISQNNNTIIADAGALLSQVIQFSLKKGLVGMEKFMGLPGTIGGAVRGNAGAFDIEIKDIFQKAIIYNQEKGVHEEDKDYFKFSYRASTIKKRKGKDIILRAYFTLKKGDTEKAVNETAKTIKSRAGKQPSGKTCGSFFKNPEKNAESAASAGELLDKAGCKGMKVGDLEVSDLHANWIINNGKGTQKDLIELTNQMKAKVQELFGVTLEPEVQLVSETGFLTQ